MLCNLLILTQLFLGVIETEKAIIEIKCFPSLVRTSQTIDQAAKERKGFPVMIEENKLIMNKKHHYYYQVNNSH